MTTAHLAVAVAAAVVLVAGCATTTSRVAAGDPPSTTASASRPSTAATAAAPSTTAASASSTSTGAASYGPVNRAEPTAVAEALLAATFTSDTATDTSPQNAVIRSLIWYTAAEAATIRSEEPTGPAGAQWTLWAAHHVSTSVAVAVNHDPGAPADTATVAYRQFAVTVTPQGSNGWTTPPDVYECFIVLTRPATHGVWQVSSLQTDQ
jgi:hypothetical protein